MENKHSSDGIAEDLIRSFTQVANAELHAKTLLEKRISEIENGFVDDEDIESYMNTISNLKEDISEYAQTRRNLMLYLYKLYKEKGNKEYWCIVKHLSMAMYTCFEAWQATDNDEELLSYAIELNKHFIKAMTQFLGVEVTSCASCFSDILKAN